MAPAGSRSVPEISQPRVGSVRATVFVGLVPLDYVSGPNGVAVIASQHQHTVSISCSTLGVAPDATDLVLNRQVVLYKVKQSEAAFIAHVIPELTSKWQRCLARVRYVADHQHRDAIFMEDSSHALQHADKECPIGVVGMLVVKSRIKRSATGTTLTTDLLDPEPPQPNPVGGPVVDDPQVWR